MSKMCEMEATIRELRDIASSINDIANWLTGAFSGTEEAAPAPEPEKVLTLEEVRAILAEKSRDGFTAQIRGLLLKYGAKKTCPDPWSYANVWEAKSINGGTPKFSVSLIIQKTNTVTVQKIKAAIQAAYEEGQAKLKGNGRTVPPLTAIKTPLRDGDTERPDDPAYGGSYFINANFATAPGIVDADCNPILTRSEIYYGVYGRASINFYAFNSNGNKGIACGLNNLQKIRDDEPFGGKSSAASDFSTDADEDFLS